MRHVIPVDFSRFPERFHGERLASPASGNQSCFIICSRVPAGDQGPKLHVHAADQFYYILFGTMTVQLGIDRFVVGPDTLVFIPQGTPHSNWNAGEEPEAHLEVIVPAPAENVPLVMPAQPRQVPDAERLIRGVSAAELERLGHAGLQVAGRHIGSRHAAIHVARTDPGSGDSGARRHASDQYHYVKAGTLDVEIGAKPLRAGQNSLIVLPRGVLHRIWNDGPEAALHVIVTVPELDGHETPVK